ncbi:MAG: response regulator [Flavobacteriales bacterium]|nr:response regulator [Flavobacteriales bacterium]
MLHLLKAPLHTDPLAPTRAVTRILVVDDNKDAALMLGLLLREMGYEAMATDKVMDGLMWAHNEHPQVVLLDLEMPGMDGYETCRLLRTSKWGARATVVAITGHTEPEDRARSKAAGFDYHLAKPIDRALLFSVLNVSAAERAAGPQ